MLVPQHPNQWQLCPRCGRLPAYLTISCPSCGMPLALPWLGEGSGFNPQGQYPPLVVPQPPNYTPLLIEMLLNFLGIYGVGWLMFGQIAGGSSILVVSLLLWPVVALVGIFTMGLGLICLGPLAIGAMILNLVLLQQAIKRKAQFHTMQW
ncbi:MAG TPA: hypothetical protein VFV38_31665 [Ktedonobacteraceae bacterium]|nr:hypothetical protein [Ktedonobacteraceae bacterium]